MANHFHLLIKSPAGNLDEIMNYLMREVSKEMGKRSSRTNHLFGGRYKSTLITEATYFAHAYKYVYRNPVEAGRCEEVQEYPFSTFSYLVAERVLPFPLFDDEASAYGQLHPDLHDRGKWMNKSYPPLQKKLVRLGLRRQEFKFSRERQFRHAVAELRSKR